MLTFDVNWLAIVAGTVANMVIGALWYGPLLGKPWMKELGLSMEDVQSGNMAVPYLIAVLNSFLMSFVLANVVAWTGASGIGSGLLLGLVVWVGFTGFTFAANHAFEGRSAKLWFINSVVYLCGLLVIGAILGAWQ